MGLLGLAFTVAIGLAWKDDAAMRKAQHAQLAARAAMVTEAGLANSAVLQDAVSSLPACDENQPPITNKDFVPPVPYFIAERYAGTHRLTADGEETGSGLALLLPAVGLERIAIKPFSRNDGIQLHVAMEDIDSELTAHDLIGLRLDNGAFCRVDVRLHMARAPGEGQAVPVKIFGRLGMSWGRFALPYGTDIDQELQTILVSDCTNGLVQEFDFDGRLVGLIGASRSKDEALKRPSDIKLHEGKVYVVEEHGHRYRVFARDGREISTHGAFKEHLGREIEPETTGGEPTFNNPLGIAIDSNGDIFAVDYGNNRLLKLDKAGRVIRVTAPEAVFDGKPLDGPYYIDINRKLGRVYIDDRGNDRIVVLDRYLEFLFAFGAHGSGPGEFHFPHEIEVAPDGRLFVADTYNRRIEIFDSDGNYLDEIVTGMGLGLPKTVAVSQSGHVLTGHLGADAYMAVWNDPGTGQQPVRRPIGSRVGTIDTEQLQLAKKEVEAHLNRTVYRRVCAACHDGGALGAPRTKNDEDWARFPRDLNALLAMARQGKGAMMPSGGCPECSDEDLREAIRFMLPETWNEEMTE